MDTLLHGVGYAPDELDELEDRLELLDDEPLDDELLDVLDDELLDDDELVDELDDELDELLLDELEDDEELPDEELLDDDALDDELVLDDELDPVDDDELLEPVELDDELDVPPPPPPLDEDDEPSGDVGSVVHALVRPAASTAAGAPDSSSRNSRRFESSASVTDGGCGRFFDSLMTDSCSRG